MSMAELDADCPGGSNKYALFVLLRVMIFQGEEPIVQPSLSLSMSVFLALIVCLERMKNEHDE